MTRISCSWTLALCSALVATVGCIGVVENPAGQPVPPEGTPTPPDGKPAGAVGTGGGGGGGGGSAGISGSGGMGVVPPVSGGSPEVSACIGAAPAVGAGKWRRLTAVQYRNTVRDLLGVEADTSAFLLDTTSGPFATNALLPPESSDVDHYRSAAEALASAAVANMAKLLNCNTTTTGEDACATRFITDFGARAYRRVLSVEEKAALTTLYTVGKEESFAAGIRLVVEGALQSPNFLYLTEYGQGTTGARKLNGPEVASRLSYLLWNSMPDPELAANVLDTPDAIRTQAQRLMTSARFNETLNSFHTQMLGIVKLTQPGQVSKDATAFPQFDAAMKAAMLDETTRFLSYVFSKGDGTVATILAAPYGFPTGPLVKLYNAPAGDADGRVNFTDGTRFGILTQASALATQPPVQTLFQAVQRGKSVRTNLLCQDIPPPPGDVKFGLPPGADKMTQQQLLHIHQQNPTCAPCHQLMDSIGFGLENYDAIGQYRTIAADGSAIDASGDVMRSDVAGAFRGPKELAEKLAQSQDVRSCMAKQWFRFALGRDPATQDGCSMTGVSGVLRTGRGDVREALLALVTSDAFRYRRGE
ncbi:MAG: DUF1592 domain-containing protein [Bacteroidota bacterium]